VLKCKDANLLNLEISDIQEKSKMYEHNIELDPDNTEDWKRHIQLNEEFIGQIKNQIEKLENEKKQAELQANQFEAEIVNLGK
jgi:hypothetical protein